MCPDWLGFLTCGWGNKDTKKSRHQLWFFFFLLVGLILLTDTEFITVCVCTSYSSSVDKESFILHSYLTNGLMWHSTEQSWNLLHILHPAVLPKGCEPQVLRESRCNILFMYHISKSPATWKGNNRVQTFSLCPLSFFTHEILRKLPLSPPPKKKKESQPPNLCLCSWTMCAATKEKAV